MFIKQNAVRNVSTGEIIISRHRHDYATSKDGKYFLDGGTDYTRTNIPFKSDEWEWLTLDNKYDKIDVIKDKFVWGTRGKNGDEPLTYRFMKDFTEDHLRAIILHIMEVHGQDETKYIHEPAYIVADAILWDKFVEKTAACREIRKNLE